MTWPYGEHPPEACADVLLDLLDEWYTANCLDIDPAQGIGVERRTIEETKAVLVGSGRYRDDLLDSEPAT